MKSENFKRILARRWVESVSLPDGYVMRQRCRTDITVTLKSGYAFRDTLLRSKTFKTVKEAVKETWVHGICRPETHVMACKYATGALWFKRHYCRNWECYGDMSETEAKQIANLEFGVLL